ATGNAFVFTVTAEDQFNNTDPTYAGTVRFSSSDSTGSLPLAVPLTGGVGTLSATLQEVGSQTLTAADTSLPSLMGIAPITVTTTLATHFLVSAPSATAGTFFTFTVTALSAANTTATGYTGTVTFSSSDSTAGFSQLSGTLTNSVGTFGVTLDTAGNQTVTA